MDIVARPCKICGTVNAVSSKSEAHRIFLSAALSENQSTVELNDTSLDIDATLECIKAMGTEITRRDNLHTVTPSAYSVEAPMLDCRSSGSTLRFFLPAVTALFEKAEFRCGEQLRNRPIKPLLEALEKNGVSFSGDRLPLDSFGKLHAGDFRIPGNISSQFISGLLFALPLLEGNSRIIIDSPMRTMAYAEMTIKILHQFGIKLLREDNIISVPGCQKYRSSPILSVGGDYANSAFMLGAAAIGGNCAVRGLMSNSVQNDKAILELLMKYGADLKINGDVCTVSANDRRPITADVSDIPDLFPALAVMACAAEGKSHFYGTGRLRYKESDRCRSVKAMLEALGVKCVALDEEFVIFGTGKLRGGIVQSFNDHRIVMAAVMASAMADGDISINNCSSVRKSYPEFFKDFGSIGGSLKVGTLK